MASFLILKPLCGSITNITARLRSIRRTRKRASLGVSPEVKDTISLAELEEGDALDTQRIDAIVAFLKTLTDARYEPLLAEQEMAQKE